MEGFTGSAAALRAAAADAADDARPTATWPRGSTNWPSGSACGRQPGVLLVDHPGLLFVCGLWGPRLVLPRSLPGSLSAADMDQVILHELAHLRRGDLYWGWTIELARILYFFHPLVYWVGLLPAPGAANWPATRWPWPSAGTPPATMPRRWSRGQPCLKKRTPELPTGVQFTHKFCGTTFLSGLVVCQSQGLNPHGRTPFEWSPWAGNGWCPSRRIPLDSPAGRDILAYGFGISEHGAIPWLSRSCKRRGVSRWAFVPATTVGNDGGKVVSHP